MEKQIGMKKAVKRHISFLLSFLLCFVWAQPVAGKAAGGQQKEMRLIKTEGAVEITSAGGKALEQPEEKPLPNGSLIGTGRNSRAWMGREEAKELRLEAGGFLEVRTGKETPEILLQAGMLYFHTQTEPEGLGIRTATAAFRIENARGCVHVADTHRTIVYMLEGTGECSVTDPVSGQVKRASLQAGDVAECIVYQEPKNGERCQILFGEQAEKRLAEAEEQRKNGEAPIDFGEENERIGKPEGAALANRQDPVWEREEALAQLADTDAPKPQNPWDTDAPKPQNPWDTDAPKPQNPPQETKGEEDTSSSSSKPDSEEPKDPGSSLLPDPKPVPEEPETPGTSLPPDPDPTPGEPETPGDNPQPDPPAKTKGLVLDGIAVNGTDGVIEIKAGGRVSFGDSSALENQGQIQSSGSVDGKICNTQGTLELTSGTIVEMEQSGGTVKLSGGIIQNGYTVTGGTFEMTGGTLKAGSEGAALTVEKGDGTSETNVRLTGGTLLNESGGPAIEMKGGVIEISEEASIRGKDVGKTLDLTSLEEAAHITYKDAQGGEIRKTVNPGEEPVALYMAQKGTDGLVTLRYLGDDFSHVMEMVNAGRGDEVTLKKDVSAELTDPLELRGGREQLPVHLNLDGNQLTIKRDVADGEAVFRVAEDAVWEIQGGTITADLKNMPTTMLQYASIIDMGRSNVTISDITMDLGSVGRCGIHNKGGNLVIHHSDISQIGTLEAESGGSIALSGTEANVVLNKSGSSLTVSKGSVIGSVTNTASHAEIEDSTIHYGISNGEGATLSLRASVSERRIQNNKSMLYLSGATVKDQISNVNFSVAEIKNSAMEAKIYNGSGSRITISENSELRENGAIECEGTDSRVDLLNAHIEMIKSVQHIYAMDSGEIQISDSAITMEAVSGQNACEIKAYKNGKIGISDSQVNGEAQILAGNLKNAGNPGTIEIRNASALAAQVIRSDEGAVILSDCKGVELNSLHARDSFVISGSEMQVKSNMEVYSAGSMEIQSGSRITTNSNVGIQGVFILTDSDMELGNAGSFECNGSADVCISGDSVVRGKINISRGDSYSVKLKIHEGAVISYEGVEPVIGYTAINDRNLDQYFKDVIFAGGRIVNTGEGPGLRIYCSDSGYREPKISWESIGTQIRTAKGNPVDFYDKYAREAFLPSGYEAGQDEEGYRCLAPKQAANAILSEEEAMPVAEGELGEGEWTERNEETPPADGEPNEGEWTERNEETLPADGELEEEPPLAHEKKEEEVLSGERPEDEEDEKEES